MPLTVSVGDPNMSAKTSQYVRPRPKSPAKLRGLYDGLSGCCRTIGAGALWRGATHRVRSWLFRYSAVSKLRFV